MNSNESKKLILEQAFRLFTEEGPKNFTIECLASDLGMSKKTIYKYFPSKDDLVEKIFEFFTDSIKEYFEKVKNSNENPISKLFMVMEFLLNRITYVPTKSLIDIKIRYPHIWKKIEQFRLEMTKNFSYFFKEAQEQGLAKPDLEMDKVAIIYMNMINSTFQPEFFLSNNLAPIDTIKLFMQMITEGLLTEKGISAKNKTIYKRQSKGK